MKERRKKKRKRGEGEYKKKERERGNVHEEGFSRRIEKESSAVGRSSRISWLGQSDSILRQSPWLIRAKFGSKRSASIAFIIARSVTKST